jgi:Family of unknown function (DUF6232)
MTTYYRDDRVRVTGADLWVDGQRYALADLTYVWHCRGTPDARTLSRRTGRWALLAAKTPVLLRFSRAVPNLYVRIALVIAGYAALLALTWPLAELLLRGIDHVNVHGVVVHEIWAQWRGTEVLLLRTGDALRFGRIYRALERALDP